jgi:hypothetical protein
VAHNFKLATAAVDVAANAVTTLLNGGKLRIYSGAQPANANATAGFNTLLAELTFGAPAFDPAVAGMATARPLTADGSAKATGTAIWFRALKSDDTPIFDGSVDTSGADLNLTTAAILQNAIVSISSLTYSHPKS